MSAAAMGGPAPPPARVRLERVVADALKALPSLERSVAGVTTWGTQSLGLLALSAADGGLEELRSALASSHAHLLAPVTRAEEGAKLRALGAAVGGRPELAALVRLSTLPSVPTAADAFLSERIGATVHKLTDSADSFEGHATGHSCVIYGPRGAGKTEALKRIAVAAALRHPSLRVVYVNARGMRDRNHPLAAHGGLSGLLEQTLWHAAPHASAAGGPAARVGATTSVPAAAGACVAGTAAGGGGLAGVLERLCASNEHALVIVDGFDGLYETDSDAAFATLEELARLSDTALGRTAVVCVSSSSCAGALVRGGRELAGSGKMSLFRLAASRFLSDMNGSKLRTVRMPALPPFLASAVAPFCHDTAPEGTLRVVAFALGSNARALHHGTLPSTAPRVPPRDGDLSDALLTTGYAFPCVAAYPQAAEFLRRLYTALAERNHHLLQRVLDPGAPSSLPLLQRIDVDAVRRIDWASEFVPLQPALVRSIARALWAPRRLTHTELNNALGFLHVDAAAIVIACHDDDAGGAASSCSGALSEYPVYPPSPLLLLLHTEAQHGTGGFGYGDATLTCADSGCGMGLVLRHAFSRATWGWLYADIKRRVSLSFGKQPVCK
jgi:hypothetical protein